MHVFPSRPFLSILTLLICLCWSSAGSSEETREQPGVPLQLDVSLNGKKAGLIGSFSSLGGRRLAATQDELDALGLVPPRAHVAGLIPLDEVAGLTYRYDEERQTIDLIASDVLLKSREIGPPRPEPIRVSDSNLIGAVINYGFNGSFYDSAWTTSPNSYLAWQQQSLSFDSRIFGPFGIFANSGYFGARNVDQEHFVRLETTWSFADPETLSSWRAGDVITRSPLWARSIRLGGAQVQTDFALRPDLITAPLPAFRGSAAVPSSVDVFINNTLAYSQNVQPGPFVLSNLPTVNGAGNANIVVRDATGRESIQGVSFYSAPTLLRGSLFDFSIEAGFVRENYGIVSDDYDSRPVGSGSVRYGLTDDVTLEGHGEVGSGLLNAGVGTSFNLFNISLWSFATSASSYDGGVGAQVYGAVQTQVGPLNVRLSTQRTIGDYKDLASVVPPSGPTWGLFSLGLTNLDVPKALDIGTVSFALPERSGSVSLSVLNRTTEDQASRIVTGSYSLPLFGNSSLMASGFHDFESSNVGLFVGLSIPLGDAGHSQLGLNQSGGQARLFADYAKVATQEPGSFGWRIAESEGDAPIRSAAMTQQGSVARVEAGVDQVANSTRGRVTVDGAVVITNRGAFLSNRINDAFAVVDVGAPQVDVLVENRKVTTTNAQGLALVPTLRSYQRNKISIDPDSLPADMTAPEVVSKTVPRDRGGVAVTLKASRTTGAAVVVLRTADGTFVPPGTPGIVLHSNRHFVVGYDGRAFIDDLTHHNQVQIETPGQSCTGSFEFNDEVGAQVVIDGVICK